MSGDKNKGRRVFLSEHPVGPWTCVVCNEPITEKGKSNRGLQVHHKDKDIGNNRLDNLEPLHGGCHGRHHYPERQDSMEAGHRTPEARQRRSALTTIQWQNNRDVMMASLRRS